MFSMIRTLLLSVKCWYTGTDMFSMIRTLLLSVKCWYTGTDMLCMIIMFYR
jgi:hypothetical protein